MERYRSMKGHSLRNKMNSEAQKQPGAKKKSLKILAVLLTVSMLFSLASCGKKKDSDNTSGASGDRSVFLGYDHRTRYPVRSGSGPRSCRKRSQRRVLL